MSKPLTLEELLIAHYEPIVCPDAGEFLILPYISAGALDEFYAAKEDAITAFAQLFGCSVDQDAPAFESLSKVDCDTIAELMATSADFHKEYREARNKHGVFDAFREAFLRSETKGPHIFFFS